VRLTAGVATLARRLEQRLASHNFVRVHRSAIVNVDRIKELEPWFHGEYVVILKDGTKAHLECRAQPGAAQDS